MSSWNVRTLSEAGALKQLDDALATLSMDLVALQEIRWLGNGVHNRRGKQCYDIYYSCHHVLGTGFPVGPRLKSVIINFKAINDRLCTLRIFLFIFGRGVNVYEAYIKEFASHAQGA